MTCPPVTVVAARALSYSGTTWMNLVLGSHAKAFTLGPPDIAWGLRHKGFEGANLVWKEKDTFWRGFDKYWDRQSNFLIALAQYAKVTHLFMDGPSAAFSQEVLSDPGLHVLHPVYVRDGRAISASYARRNRDRGYLASILPGGWMYNSFRALSHNSGASPAQVIRYEDSVARPLEFLEKMGRYLNLEYTPDALRFWAHDHHITSGNQGTIATLRLAKGLPIDHFESETFYREQLARMERDHLAGFIDDRWDEELSRLERFYFDILLGADNQALGYARDQFSPEEVRDLLEMHGREVSAGRAPEVPRRLLHPYLVEHGLAKQGAMARVSEPAHRAIRGAHRQANRLRSLGWTVLLRARALRTRLKARTEKAASPSAIPPSGASSEPIYFDEQDPARLRALTDYKVRPSRKPLDVINREINRNFYQLYGPDYLAVPEVPKVCVDPLLRYDALLRGLRDIPNLRFVTALELYQHDPTEQGLLCHIRHDVDGDLVSARAQAILEHELGIKSTYYILHTAPYYGLWNADRKRFERNVSAIGVYQEIEKLGHEVGLHSDPLFLYQNHNVDGVGALRTELEWLRSNGLTVAGTVAHNSVTTYGAVNYAVFKGRNVSFIAPPGPAAVEKDGKWAPLQVISEQELGLDYEGNDLFWQTHTRVEYYCLMSQNEWFYQAFEGGSILPKNQSERAEEWKPQETVLDEIVRLKGPVHLVLSVHPMHYGLRPSIEAFPALPSASSSNLTTAAWRLFAPGQSVSVSGGTTPRRPEFDAHNVANDLGQLDLPTGRMRGQHKRVLFLGRDMLACPSIPTASKVSQVVGRLLARRLGTEIVSTSVAQCPSTPSLQVAGLKRALEKLEPDAVVLSVGADDIIGCTPNLFRDVMNLDAHEVGLLFDAAWNDATLNEVDLLLSAGRPADLSTYHGTIANDFFRPGEELSSSFTALWNEASQRLRACIRHLQRESCPVLLLLEECGEKGGRWKAATSSDEQVVLARSADTRFGNLAEEMGVTFVNPYESFATTNSFASSHWTSIDRWSLHGHYLCARVLMDPLAAVLSGSSTRPN